MKLETTRFGVIEVDPDTVITLTQPILGFQECRRFVLLPGPSDYIRWLQSIDDGELAFILMNPNVVMPNYVVDIGPHELAELGVTSVAELEAYALVVVPQDPGQVRTNLKAPILINPKQRLGKQTILDRSNYPIQHFLAQARRDPQASPEVSHARTDA